MESLTCCPTNRTRLAVRIIRKDTAGPAMKSLTSCQAIRARLGMRTVRINMARPGITHFLSSQWDQIRSEDNKKGHS